MSVFFWIVFAIAILLAISIVNGAPYLPTPRKQIETAFKLSKLKKGEKLVDLGSGDGTVLVYAAKRGIDATGYEINPLLWLISSIRLLPYRRIARVKLTSFWDQPLGKFDVVFVFLIGHHMQRLEDKLSSELKRTRVISHAFEIPGRKGRQENGLFLYKYL